MSRRNTCKPQRPPYVRGIQWGSDSIVDSEFDSTWRPPLTLQTESVAPKPFDGWRSKREGVE